MAIHQRFFKTFSVTLAPLLLSVFKESLSSLAPTMREATISLILKKDKNPLHCSSDRPISLLITDVKLLAKLLAQRLDVALPLIITADQTGFMKDRYSFSNIRCLLNIFYSPSPSNTPEILLSLNTEKAFDQVAWDLFYTQNSCPGLRLFTLLQWLQYIPTITSLPTLNLL